MRTIISVFLGLVGSFIAFRIGSGGNALGALIWFFFAFGGLGLITYFVLMALHRQEIADERCRDQVLPAPSPLERHEPPEVDYSSAFANSEQLPGVVKKMMEAEFVGDAKTEEEREGRRILFKMATRQGSFEPSGADWLCKLILDHASAGGGDDAKRFVALLGRQSTESIETWYARVNKLAPFELDTEDATKWLTYVYRLGQLLNVKLWFGLDEVEEAAVREKVQSEIREHTV